jgi:recombination protein RecR
VTPQQTPSRSQTQRTWNNLVAVFSRLPGVGPKMAERLALYILRRPQEADELLKSVTEARKRLARCPQCGDIVEHEGDLKSLCDRCCDTPPDPGLMCVVEEIGDLYAIAKSHVFDGRYHVLGGVLSALDGVGPEQLRIDILLSRVQKENVREVILATNPTVEGETTAHYIAGLLKPRGVSISRLAYGLPSGSSIQYADEITLGQAIKGRQAVS